MGAGAAVWPCVTDEAWPCAGEEALGAGRPPTASASTGGRVTPCEGVLLFSCGGTAGTSFFPEVSGAAVALGSPDEDVPEARLWGARATGGDCRICGGNSLPGVGEGLAGRVSDGASPSPGRCVDCLPGAMIIRLAERPALLAADGPTFRAGDNGTGSAAGTATAAGAGEAASGFGGAEESKRAAGAGWASVAAAGAATGFGDSPLERRKRRFQNAAGLAGASGFGMGAFRARTSACGDGAGRLSATAGRGTNGFFCAMAGVIGRGAARSAAGGAASCPGSVDEREGAGRSGTGWARTGRGGSTNSRRGRHSGIPSRQKKLSGGTWPAAKEDGRSRSSNWPITSPLAER